MSLPFKPLGNRVVIKADVEDRAPEPTDSGLLTAKTLAAAVDGSDVEDSWFVGTIVACGPLANHFDVRQFVLRKLAEEIRLCGDCSCDTSTRTCESVTVNCVRRLYADISDLPHDCPDPLHVGDRVTFSWAAGQQITVDGERYLIMPASDVLAILED